MSLAGSNIRRHYFKATIDLRFTNPTLTMTRKLSLCHNARGAEIGRGSKRVEVGVNYRPRFLSGEAN
jgi:hypothetical protein